MKISTSLLSIGLQTLLICYIIATMKFIALKKHIAEDSPEAFYVLTGDDSYIIKKAAEMIRGFIVGMTDFNLHVFSENNTASEIVAACKTLPLLGGRIIVEVSNFSKDAAGLAEYLKTPSSDAILVVIAPVLSKNLSAIIKSATIVECDRLDALSLKKWVLKRCLDNGSAINEDAAATLITYSDRFMSRIEVEADKLSAYKYKSTINLIDVENLVTPSFEYKIYELGDAMLAGKSETALRILKTILDSSPANYVISGLYTHFRRLLYAVICKEENVAEYLGVKEFAITAARRQAVNVSPKKLKIICDRLQEADYGFKSGRINDIIAVETFVANTAIELNGR